MLEELSPVHLEIVNESYMHNVPKGSETHFKGEGLSVVISKRNLIIVHFITVLIVTEKFEGIPLIKVSPISMLEHRCVPMNEFYDNFISETSHDQRLDQRKVAGAIPACLEFGNQIAKSVEAGVSDGGKSQL